MTVFRSVDRVCRFRAGLPVLGPVDVWDWLIPCWGLGCALRDV